MAAHGSVLQHMTFLFHFLCILLIFNSNHLPATFFATATTQPPRFFKGMFVFGSSTVDNGNNNYLLTRAKVNYTPYGIDFPLSNSTGTGRFSNGDNIVDLVSRRLNLPLIKPFLDPSNTGKEIIGGVNYGSGAAGILNNTGAIFGQVISWSQQVNNFESVTLPELIKLQGKPSEDQVQLLSRYLFFLVPSGNDYQANYFRNGGANMTVEAFTSTLISQFSTLIERLYQSGARNFFIINMFPIGCVPFVRTVNGCNDTLNAATQLFNSRLTPLLDNIKRDHHGFEFVLVNSYKIISDIIRYPFLRGFSNVSAPCCELDDIRLFCKRNGVVCKDRSKYVFFDAQHLSTAAADIIASKGYSSTLGSEVYPFNLWQLELRRSFNLV